MSWKDKMKEFGGGDLAFLSEDAEAIHFIVVGEPVLLEGRFKGRPSEKIGCPVITPDGFALFVAGKRLARKIAKHEYSFNVSAFTAVRHGQQNDITATYDLIVMANPELTATLFAMVESQVTPAIIEEAVQSALAVMRQ